jgi:hypothetical protein
LDVTKRTPENPVQANFHEKAHFVKADLAALIDGRALRLFVLRAMLPSALLVSPLLGDSVHYGIHLLGLIEGAAIFIAVSLLLPERMDQVRNLRSRLLLDPKRSDTQKPYVSL